MKFAVFTASLPLWTPEEAAAELAAAGYDGIEWRITDQKESAQPGFWAGNRCTWPFASLSDDIEKIAETARGNKLEMPSLGTYASCTVPEDVERVMQAAAALGVPQLRVTLPMYDPKDSYRAIWLQRRTEYAVVADLAARHGVKALVEIHHRTPVQSPHAAASFVDGFDPAHVGVIHDAGNMVFEGWSDYRLGLEVLGDHLAHVHLKSGRWDRGGERADGSTDWKGVPAPLRSGLVDVPALFRALRQVGYDRWVTFEDFSTELPQAERIRDNLAYAKASLAGSAGNQD
jgi:sugar phosphate isomerase/epimerase